MPIALLPCRHDGRKHRFSGFASCKRAVAAGEVTPLYGSQPVEMGPDTVLLRIGDEEVELANEDVFVFAGGVRPFELLRGVGAAFGGAGN